MKPDAKRKAGKYGNSSGQGEDGKFTISMSFLRDIIGRHHFGNSPSAALRELVQNAHDACLQNAALSGRTDHWVRITLDPADQIITIRDNGIGMTPDDIERYLTTIGSGSKTKPVLDSYAEKAKNKEQLENIIGEFGFGFAAAFVIADQVEMWTKSSINPDSKGVHCIFSIDQVGYTCEEGKDDSEILGTTLKLKVNPDIRKHGIKVASNLVEEGDILSLDTVNAIIQKYAVLLEYPIYVNHVEDPTNPTRSNLDELPWHRSRGEIAAYLKSFYQGRIGVDGIDNISMLFPISKSRQKGDPVTLEGVFFVEDGPPRSQPAGNIEVFVKRMWVCENQQKLLPAWASFLRGVLVTPDLRPVPSRDGLESSDRSYNRVKEALHEILIDGFLEYAQQNPNTFDSVMQNHGDAFRRGIMEECRKCKEHDIRELKDIELVRYIKFQSYSNTSLNGRFCNINEYLKIENSTQLDTNDIDEQKVVHIVLRTIMKDREQEFRRMLTSRNTPVIVPEDDGQLFIIASLNKMFPDIVLKEVEVDIIQNYTNLLQGNQMEKWKPFVHYLERLSEEHGVASIEVGEIADPLYMPILILSTLNSDGRNKRPVSNNNGIPKEEKNGSGKRVEYAYDHKNPFVSELLADIYKKNLVINSRNHTMRAIMEYYEDSADEDLDNVLKDSLHQCYHIALQTASTRLDDEAQKHHVELASDLIKAFVEAKKQQRAEAASEMDKYNDLVLAKKTIEEYQRQFGILDHNRLAAPEKPVDTFGVVTICDIIGSTGTLLSMDVEERTYLLSEFVNLAKRLVKTHQGFFGQFTGDGLVAFFGLNAAGVEVGDHLDREREACRQAWKFARALDGEIEEFNLRKEISEIFERHGTVDIRLRVSLDAGQVSFGQFGVGGTAIGIPLIRATRLCELKEVYKTSGSSILATQYFHQKAGIQGLRELQDEAFVPRGLTENCRVFQAESPQKS